MYCVDLICALRDMLVIKTAGGKKELLSAPEDEAEKLKSCADGFSVSRILALSDAVLAEKDRLSRSGGKKLDFEILLFKLCNPETVSDLSALEERIGRIEKRLEGAPAPAPAPKKLAVKPAAEKPAAAPAAPAGGTPPFWAELLQKADPALASTLKLCRARLEGTRLVIEGNELCRKMLSMQLPRKNLETALAAVSDTRYEIVLREKDERDAFSTIENFKFVD